MYYLRDRKGKSARIAEKIKSTIGVDISEQVVSKETVTKKEEPQQEAPKTELKKEKK